MDIQRGPFVNWTYFGQGKSLDQLRQSLLLTTMELENSKLKAQEELKIRDEQITQLKDFLSRVIKERDEAEDRCQRLILEKLFLQQQYQQSAPLSGNSSIEDEPRRRMDSHNGFSTSDCEESIVSSPVLDPIPPPEATPAPAQAPVEPEPALPILPDRPLPEKGKLLQAVMKAGPLLQTLLLAGPLPQWRHPPPPLDTYQIPPPPVVVPSAPPTITLPPVHSLQQDSLLCVAAYNSNINSCGRINNKRSLCEGTYFPTETKCQRLVLHQ